MKTYASLTALALAGQLAAIAGNTTNGITIPSIPVPERFPSHQLEIELFAGQRSSLGVWEFHDPITHQSQGRWLYWDVLIRNTGDATWSPRGIDLVPDWTGWRLAVANFYYVTLTDASGNVVFEESRSMAAAWAVVPPGGIVYGFDPGWEGTWLWLGKDPPNGDYTLQITLDPFRIWGQPSRFDIPFTLDYFNAYLR